MKFASITSHTSLCSIQVKHYTHCYNTIQTHQNHTAAIYDAKTIYSHIDTITLASGKAVKSLERPG